MSAVQAISHGAALQNPYMMQYHDGPFVARSASIFDDDVDRGSSFGCVEAPLALATYACKQAFVPLNRMNELVADSNIRSGLNRVAAAVKGLSWRGNALKSLVTEKRSGNALKSMMRDCDLRPSAKQNDVRDAHSLSADKQEVNVAIVGPKQVPAGAKFTIKACAYDAESNVILEDFVNNMVENEESILGSTADNKEVQRGDKLSYVLTFCGQNGAGSYNSSQIWEGTNKPMDITCFKVQAPDELGMYQGTLLVLHSRKGSPVTVAGTVRFFVRVGNAKSKNWWDTVFDKFTNVKSVNLAHPVLQRKLSSLSNVVSSIASKCNKTCYRTHVLSTLLIKLKTGSSNERLIAAAALADMARHENVRSVIVDAGVVDPLAHLAFFGEEFTQLQARTALQLLTFGNTYNADLVVAAVEKQARAYAATLLVVAMASAAAQSAQQSVALNAVAHQMGTGYRSNNAGDGPEKTRDSKWWFPRFKSNWFGDFRSKNLYPCCECNLQGEKLQRCNRADGKHCLCGADKWREAREEEMAEMKSRQLLSQTYGGIRYEEALVKAQQEQNPSKRKVHTLDDGIPGMSAPASKRPSISSLGSPATVAIVAKPDFLFNPVLSSNSFGLGEFDLLPEFGQNILMEIEADPDISGDLGNLLRENIPAKEDAIASVSTGALDPQILANPLDELESLLAPIPDMPVEPPSASAQILDVFEDSAKAEHVEDLLTLFDDDVDLTKENENTFYKMLSSDERLLDLIDFDTSLFTNPADDNLSLALSA